MSDMRKFIKQSSDEDWEEGKLGASEKFVRKTSVDKEKEIDENLGLQMISIRLQKELIEEIKALAKESGIGYQPYIRQILTQYIHRKKKRDGTYG